MSLLARLLLAAALAASAGARGAETLGRLAGVVLDGATRLPVAEATVVARSASLPGEQAVQTDARGAFEMTFLPGGEYAISVQRSGREVFSATNVPVREGRLVQLTIALGPEETSARPPASAPPAPQPQQQEPETAVELTDGMIPPVLLSGPTIEYTPEATSQEVEGKIEVRCVITASGAVRSCRVLQGLPLMNRAVLQALLRRKYRPAMLAGKPLDVFYVIGVQLRLGQ